MRRVFDEITLALALALAASGCNFLPDERFEVDATPSADAGPAPDGGAPDASTIDASDVDAFLMMGADADLMPIVDAGLPDSEF